jgi:hypothetical protein
MAEAANILSGNRRTDHQLRQQAMVVTMARFLARKAIKEHLRANGIRTWDIEPAELNRAASAYLEVRRVELMAEAKAVICRAFRCSQAHKWRPE